MIKTFGLLLLALIPTTIVADTAPPVTATPSTAAPITPLGATGPTLCPSKDFDAKKDAEAIQKAIDGMGTSTDDLNNIVGKRSLEQRLQIKEKFLEIEKDGIIDQLEEDLSGSYEKLVTACFKPLIEIYTNNIRNAMKNAGTDERTVTEIVVTVSKSSELKSNLKSKYEESYQGEKLVDAIKNDCTGDYGKTLAEILEIDRPADLPQVDPVTAKKDADSLHADSANWPNNIDTLKKILISTPLNQLKEITKQFATVNGRSLHEAIEDKMNDDLAGLYFELAYQAENEAEYYAHLLQRATDGEPTVDSTLIRIVVCHCEDDLKEIQSAFQAKFQNSLIDTIKNATSSNYEKLLLMLNGEGGNGETCDKPTKKGQQASTPAAGPTAAPATTPVTAAQPAAPPSGGSWW